MLEKRKLKTKRGDVFYWTTRIADAHTNAIVFLHGLTADHTLFDLQVKYFKKDYTLLCWGCTVTWSISTIQRFYI